MPLRWLITLLAFVALAGQTSAAFASAGLQIDVRCCCPDPSTCKCHDHPGRSDSDHSVDKCGGGEHVVALELTSMPPLATALEVTPVRAVARSPVAFVPVIPDDRFVEVETPPF